MSCEAPTVLACLRYAGCCRALSFFFLPDLRFTEPEWKVAAADASALLPSLMKEGKKEPIEDSRRRAAMPTHTAC